MDLIIGKNELDGIEQTQLSKWYDENVDTFEKISCHLNSELNSYKEQTGANHIDSISIRIKNKESFLDKFEKMKNDNDALCLLPDKISPQQLIKDIIGARIIFYFEHDLKRAITFFSTFPSFSIEEIEAYQTLPEESPLASKEKIILNKRIRSIFPKFTPKYKKSGYESVHLIVRYNLMSLIHLRYKKIHSNNIDIDKVKFNETHKDLMMFPIEIQVRTILQHTWAQIEHLLNYSLRKRSTSQPIDDIFFTNDFICHKSLLKAAEKYQRLMYDRFIFFRKSQLKRDIIGVGTRYLNFGNDEKRKILEIDKIIHDKKNCNITFNEIKNLTTIIEKKYKKKFLYLSYHDDFNLWVRQRVILLYWGYLLLFCDEIANEIENFLKDKSNFYNKDVVTSSVALYEHMRFMDANFRYDSSLSEEEKTLISDPLVNYRCAAAYLRLFDYRRSINLLQEVVDNHYIANFKRHRTIEPLLNEKHFFRRIGEYYIFAYIDYDLKLRDDLYNAIKYMEKALHAEGGPSKKMITEERKICSNLICYAFYKHLLTGVCCVNDYRSYINNLIVDSNIDKYFNEEELKKNKSVHALQALSLLNYGINNIIYARDLIKFTKLICEENEKINKMAPIHLIIFNHIYEFIINND